MRQIGDFMRIHLPSATRTFLAARSRWTSCHSFNQSICPMSISWQFQCQRSNLNILKTCLSPVTSSGTRGTSDDTFILARYSIPRATCIHIFSISNPESTQSSNSLVQVSLKDGTKAYRYVARYWKLHNCVKVDLPSEWKHIARTHLELTRISRLSEEYNQSSSWRKASFLKIFIKIPALGCTKMYESKNFMMADSQNWLFYPTNSLQKELGFLLQNCGGAQFLKFLAFLEGETPPERA